MAQSPIGGSSGEFSAMGESLTEQCRVEVKGPLSMTDLGSLNYFLGISVTHDSLGMFLSQRKYATEILKQAHMVGCNSSKAPVDTESKLGDGGDPVFDPTLYQSLAGSLQYLTFIRPDISYAVQQVCLYMHDPREPHFSALKRILRYVSGTLDYGYQLFSSFNTDLVAYSDADWACCPTTQRSTSVAAGQVCVLHVQSRYQFADIFTKGLPSALFEERFYLYENIACIHRELKPLAHSHPSNANERNSPGSYVSILKSGKTNKVMSDQVLPSLILDGSCISDREFSLSLLGKEKLLNDTGVGSWFSSLKPACNSFVSDERVLWISLEGLPLKVWTRNTFSKVASKWGDLVKWVDLAKKSLFCKRLCVKTMLNAIIAERFKVIVKGSMYWVRAKEMEAWDPFICNDSYENESSDDEEDAEYDKS
ncbi:ribonuclease H-like domain-containing protein [Tanacetum coccineum]